MIRATRTGARAVRSSNVGAARDTDGRLPESYTDTPRLSDAFDRALLLATDHHRRHLRKGTEVPYISHLMSVAGYEQAEEGAPETADVS